MDLKYAVKLEDFVELLSEAAPSEKKVVLLLQNIWTQYSDPNRHYHNASHIVHCFQELERVEHLIPEEQIDKIVWAILFHDYIYDTSDTKNELNSSKEAAFKLAKLKKYNLKYVDEVLRLILLTDHKLETYEKLGNPDTYDQYLLDIDLAVLGSKESDYLEYIMGIRAEYNKISEIDFLKGRMSWLEGMLSHRSIYKTKEFHDLYEDYARHNMTEELNSIKNLIGMQ